VDLVRLCRVVVTGSYHAGVFALSCGVPAIGIAKSQYYVEKFCGLAAQFGPGCEVATLDDPDFERVLREKIDRLWTAAAQLRPGLLQAAARQIALGRAAYGRLREIVTARRKVAPR
jgi:colanic acid/amylovoran biosynthesis protein